MSSDFVCFYIFFDLDISWTVEVLLVVKELVNLAEAGGKKS